MLSDPLRAAGFLREHSGGVGYLEERAGKKSPAGRAPSSPGQQRALRLHERQTLYLPGL